MAGVADWILAGGALATATSLYWTQNGVGQQVVEDLGAYYSSSGGRLRGRDALNAERRRIRYLTRGMTVEQRERFQREIEREKHTGGLGGDEPLGEDEMENIRMEILGEEEEQ